MNIIKMRIWNESEIQRIIKCPSIVNNGDRNPLYTALFSLNPNSELIRDLSTLSLQISAATQEAKQNHEFNKEKIHKP